MKVDQLLEAGFSEDEISDHVESKRTTLRAAGFSDKEIDDHYGIVHPFDLSGIDPFPTEAIAESYYDQIPTETIATVKDNLGKVMKPLTDKMEKMGVSFMHESTMVWGSLLVELQERLLYLRKKDRILRNKFGLDKREITEYSEKDDENWVLSGMDSLIRTIDESRGYWALRAKQVGPGWFDELVGKALTVGPGIYEFIYGGLPYAAMGGAVKAEKAGKGEMAGAFLEGAKWEVLSLMFRFMKPLNKWLQAPTLGTIFGLQAAIDPGATPKQIATSAALGFAFPLASRGNKMGLNEHRAGLRQAANAKLEEMKRKAIKQEIGRPLMEVDDSVDVSRTAVMHEGKVYISSTKDMATHGEILQEYGLTEKSAIRGYLDKNGSFVSIYPEEAVDLMRRWEQDGIRTGDIFVHFRETSKRVQDVLDPSEHMGLRDENEKKLADRYGREKDGGLMIDRVHGYKSPADKEGGIPSGGVYIGRLGRILRASSKRAKELMNEAIGEIQGKPKEIPGLTFTTERKGVLTYIKAKIYGRDVGEVEIVPKDEGFFLRNISVIKAYKFQGIGENLVAKATEQFGKLMDMTQKTPEGEGFFARLEKKKKYAPQDNDAIQLIFEKKVRDAGYDALDTETPQGYKIFQTQRVVNVSHNLISTLHDNLLASKEITWDLLGGGDMAGKSLYAVSTYPERTKPIKVKDFKPEDVKNYIIDNGDLLTLGDHNISGWITGDTVVLDVSRTVSSKWEAVRLGKKHGQKEVYDLQSKQSINVDEAYAQMQEGIMGGRPGLPGIPGGEPETRPRKFIQTVKESLTTEEQLRQKVSEIKPEDYEVLKDKDALAAAEFRTSTPDGITRAIQDLRDGKVSVRDQGYLGHTLMKKLQEQGDWDRAAEVVDLMDYNRRDAGRLVRTASLWGNMMNTNTFFRWAQKQLDIVNANRTWLDMHTGSKKATITQEDKVNILKMFGDLQKIADPIQKANAFLEIVDYVAKKAPPGKSEMIDAYRYQNMLSGFKTSLRNFIENTFNTFIARPFDLTTGGMIDYGKSLFTGKERTMYVKNVPAYYKAAFNAIPTALDAFKRAWGMDLALEKPELLGTKDVIDLFEARRQRQMPKSLTIVQRFMEAQDRLMSALIAAGEKTTQIKNGMSEEEATAKGVEIGQRYLYREKLKLSNKDLNMFSEILTGLGHGIEQFRRIPGIGKPAGWIVPFLRTPINKGIAMLEYSPLSFVRRPSHWTQEAQGRVMTAAIISAMGGLAAALGETTWTPPQDEEGKKWFYASGRKPFSMQIGGAWIPFWYLGPFAVAFALPAAVKYYADESNKALTDDKLEMLGNIIQGTVQFIGSQSSAQQIGNLFTTISGDVDMSLGKQAIYALGQIIPAQGLLRWVSTMIDPVYRQSRKATDEFIKNLPFLTKTLAPHEKPYGEISERENINFFLPYDLGFMDRDYEEEFIVGEMERGLEYLQGYRNRLSREYGKGLISEKEYQKKWDRSIDAIDKVIKRLDKLDTEEVK